MQIQDTLAQYKELGDYFAPEYESDNEVLSKFKQVHLTLSADQTNELIQILTINDNIDDRFFVADLLYLYDNFDTSLLVPMLDNAIAYKDPSFNRIFLNPCLTVFGVKTVANILAEKFSKADIIERVGISKLVYWLRHDNPEDVQKLHQLIIDRANETQNLVELYYYGLPFRNKIKNGSTIPDNAADFIKSIKGKTEYDDLLKQLGWEEVSFK